jgi:DNA-binding CsgD family transcriptional regulator
MKLKNEELLQNVGIKERELAVTTISLIKKNELLELIKQDLKKSELDKSLISKINSTIKEDNSFEIFSEAYDKLDTDFLKKMKQLYPTLTPSDLKLCAYLRLNLSSKEIAPMLHISIRSVEIKRYRLRKKLNLPHDEGLVNYILNIN